MASQPTARLTHPSCLAIQLAVQPLTIVGVTGLINLVNYTTYDIIKRYDVDLLQFMAWSLM